MSVQHVRDAFGVSERRGCWALRFHRSSQRYRGRRDDQAPLRLRIREIAAVRIRYGYPRIHVLLQRGSKHCFGRRRPNGR